MQIAQSNLDTGTTVHLWGKGEEGRWWGRKKIKEN